MSPLIDGETQDVAATASSFAELRRTWRDNTIRVVLPKELTVEPLPDRPDTVAFMDGPLVLAGLTKPQRLRCCSTTVKRLTFAINGDM